MDEHDRKRDGARPRDATEAARPARAPYATPRLASLGSAAALTHAVSMRGLMDGFMGNRTG